MKKYLVTLMLLSVAFLFLCAWVFFSTIRSADDVIYAKTSVEVISGILVVLNAFSAIYIAKRLTDDVKEK